MSVKVITKGEIQYLLDFIDSVISLDEALQYEDLGLPNELILMAEDSVEILESIIRGADHVIPDTAYSTEVLHNIRRTALRGRDAMAYEEKAFADGYQHILDELQRIGITNG